MENPPAAPSRPMYEPVATDGHARAGVVHTAHGSFETPVFMPVGTAATVKSLSAQDVEGLGADIMLSNTYHLALRPGHERIAGLGGLHRFMDYPGSILTDSGGFQVYSLANRRKIDDDGVTFQSHIDGRTWRFSPEFAMEVQAALGSDIAMAFDECPPADAPDDVVKKALDRTSRWAQRCLDAKAAPGQKRFGIVQGGTNLDMRLAHLEEISSMPFDGIALGGFSVGEPPPTMHRLVKEIAPHMPKERPRYLMGVGTPKDLLLSIAAGIDMFDCVMPTRNARNGQLFVPSGKLNMGNARHLDDPRPVQEDCPCEACQRYSRAYLAHLHRSKELLFARLATLHNLTYYLNLVRGARQAIIEGRLDDYVQEKLAAMGADPGDA